ncbi:hypothetical protein ES706_05189 [subsurface metagenome]
MALNRFDWVGSSGCGYVLFAKGNICGKGEKVNQQVQPLQVAAVSPSQVTAQTFQVVMGVIMVVWMGTWVLSQVIKVFKGEEVEKPPIAVK